MFLSQDGSFQVDLRIEREVGLSFFVMEEVEGKINLNDCPIQKIFSHHNSIHACRIFKHQKHKAHQQDRISLEMLELVNSSISSTPSHF